MLAEARRVMAQGAISIAEPHRRPNHPDAAFRRMVGRRKKIDGSELLVISQFGQLVDRPARNIGGSELGEPICSCLAAYAFGDQRIELGDVSAAALRIGKARIISKLGPLGDA